MRTARKTKAAICVAAVLAVVPLTVLALPSSADQPVAAAGQALTPTLAAGSFNVTTAGSRLTLGAAPAVVGSSELRQRAGIGNLEPVRLAATTSAVVVDYTASTPDNSTAAVDVRAMVGNRWTEWAPAAAGATTGLPEPSGVIQLRIILNAPPTGAAPSVSDVVVRSSSNAPPTAMAVQAAPVSSRVYATREGLVGGTTANGHVIISRDHFVALPSRRGLANKNSGNYSVKVCTASRCAFEPVWDVGPWNTKDDYWNPSATRENWKDLPQGKPEAQAAYQDGYNGGKDQFGRKVANPAGIDLADGTFWDALKMSDNGWVTATYLWSGTGGRGTVAITSGYLNVRNSASSSGAVVGMAGKAAQVTVECQVTGQSVTGSQGTTNVWLRVHAGMYVSKAWITAGSFAAC